MGISGLLPALKSIQVTRHLSEYAGKTIAVDAYVWLHRGVFTCATELATGKNTHKYVDYAMNRVRLMRHHNIEPYIVFDGGPLPAKKGTETERKQRRDESLAKGKAFLLQGKHSQARECFVKCIDVTPQMAYQFIKALRAESVSYVVAPYEADAQLAYLERIGLVDAILTEDSDLLVFGCQNVLFKMDMVTNTVVSISRKDFGSVTATSSDTNGISLLGWTDVQFRAMAILSGCDYIPSIPGIGLKTACSLLRKWKTAQQAVKAIALEGKKLIPRGYWKGFQLAEKCFLHQRVYCPKAEKLVHLTAVGDDWNDEFDAYVGNDLDPRLAKDIALGDADPTTYMPMKDINEAYKPAPRRVPKSPVKSLKSKGKMRESFPPTPKPRPQSTGGIKSFFGPNPIIPPRSPKQKKPVPVPITVKPNLTGKASGKRTLADVMDQDLESKKKARPSYSPLRPTQSKFFASGVQRRHSDGVAGPSRLLGPDKENLRISPPTDVSWEASEEDLDGSDFSVCANLDTRAAEIDMDLDPDDFPENVEQEDGYISPSPSYSKDVQDLSSPPQPGQSRKQRLQGGKTPGQTGILPSDDEDDNSFGADAISSPVSVKRPKKIYKGRPTQTPPRWNTGEHGAVLVGATPTPKKTNKNIYPDIDDLPSPSLFHGPDLRSMLKEEFTTELDFLDNEAIDEPNISGSASPPSPSPETPNTPQCQQNPVKVFIDVDELEELEVEDVQRAKASVDRTQAVMNGWRERWALSTKVTGPVEKGLASGSRPMQLRRNETNVTPSGRHSLAKAPRSALPKFTIDANGSTSHLMTKTTLKSVRHSMSFEGVKQSTRRDDVISTRVKDRRQIVDLTMSDDWDDEIMIMSPPKRERETLFSDEQVQILSSARLRLDQFRCVR